MKFDTDLAGELYASFADDEIGSVHELGWAGRYNHELVILTEDNLGFVETHQFDTHRDLEDAWKGVTDQYDKYWEKVEITSPV